MSLSLSNIFLQFISSIPQLPNTESNTEKEIDYKKNEDRQKITEVFNDFKEISQQPTVVPCGIDESYIGAKLSLPNKTTTLKNTGKKALDIFPVNRSEKVKKTSVKKKINPLYLKIDKYGFTELHRACDRGDSHVVSLLIKHGFDIENSDNRAKQTPLWIALFSGNKNCVDQLIEDGASLLGKDCYGFTPLHFAARFGWSDTAWKLMSKGLDPNDKDNSTVLSPLFYAIQCRNKECVEVFLMNGAGIGDVDDRGYTVLHWACKYGWKDIVELCVELGFELEGKTLEGKTPLLVALDTDERCAQFLIEKEVNVNAVDNLGYSPLHILSWKNLLNTAMLLISRGANLNHISNNGDTPLITAIKLGRDQYAKILVESGANLELQDHEGCTALHLSCEFEYPETVTLLLQNGANLSAKNKLGQTSLDLAIFNELQEIENILTSPIIRTPKRFVQLTELQNAALNGDEMTVKTLIFNNADINEQNNKGWSALHYACKGRHRKIVDILTICGADLNLKNDNGETALHIAFRERDRYSVLLLIKRRANVNERGEDGFLPIHFSCGYGWKDVTKLIIDKGTNIEDTGNALSISPLFLALKRGNKACAELLITRMVALKVRDENGFTPIHFACREGWLNVIKCLVKRRVNINDNSNSQQSTPLFAAINGNHKECANYLIQSAAELNIPCNKDCDLPIHMICERGWHDILRLMIPHIEQTDAINGNGYNPLIISTKFGHEKCAQILIEHEVNINSYDEEMNTPLHYACKNNLIKTARTLMDKFVTVRENKYCETPVYFALMNQSKECLKLFMHDEYYAEKDGLGRTILHIACMNGWHDMVEQIAKTSTLLDAQDDSGNTGLVLAIMNDHKKSAGILIERGVGLNTPDKNGYVPLHYLCLSEWNDLFRLILRKKLSINYNINEHKVSPLFLAIQQGNVQFTKLLLEKGASTNICCVGGFTPLHIACSLSQSDIVKLLLNMKVNPNYKGECNTTPLHLAVESEDLLSVQYLIDSGANLNEVNSSGDTPLKIAQNMNSNDIIFVLMDGMISLD